MPDMLRGKLRRVRELSGAPFGVNCLLQFPCEQIVDVCIAERLAPAVADREARTA